MKRTNPVCLELAFFYPSLRLETLCVKKLPFTIGRSEFADVCISDSTVSRVHCRVELRMGEMWIVDLCSRNGIWLNHQAVSEAPIELKQEIQIGSSLFVIMNAILPKRLIDQTQQSWSTT